MKPSNLLGAIIIFVALSAMNDRVPLKTRVTKIEKVTLDFNTSHWKRMVTKIHDLP